VEEEVRYEGKEGQEMIIRDKFPSHKYCPFCKEEKLAEEFPSLRQTIRKGPCTKCYKEGKCYTGGGRNEDFE